MLRVILRAYLFTLYFRHLKYLKVKRDVREEVRSD